MGIDTEHIREFLDRIIEPHDQQLYEALSTIFSSIQVQRSFLENINRLNLRLLRMLYQLFRYEFHEPSIREFIHLITEFGVMSSLYEKEYDMFAYIQHAFLKSALQKNEILGLCPLNLSQSGGSFLFVTRYHQSRETLARLVASLRESGFPAATIEYASWRDGTEAEPTRIDQHISHGVFSSYTDAKSVRYLDSTGRVYVAEYDTILTEEQDGILLDSIRGRIYVRGTMLTSRDLHSQNATIDILSILLKRPHEHISNTDLPSSTYAQSRSELQGKILSPLQKVAREYF